MAVAFQVSFSERFSGSTTGAPKEARQIAGSKGSTGGAPMKARASTPAGRSVPVTDAARRKLRRLGRRNIRRYSWETREGTVGTRASARRRSAATASEAGGETIVAHHAINIGPRGTRVTERENQ